MLILSWNVRGLGNSHNSEALQRMVRVHSPDVLFLIETKKQKDDMEEVGIQMGFENCFAVGSVGLEGKSGGLAMFWKSSVKGKLVGWSQAHIDMSVQADADPVRLIGFYGNPDSSKRAESWILLRRLCETISGAGFIFGDFNELIDSSEKIGGAVRPEAQMRKFREAIMGCDLLEVPFSGSTMTWSNGITAERLDRGLVNSQLYQLWPNLIEKHVDGGSSDHLALLFYSDGGKNCGKRRRQRRFQFEPFWVKEAGCRETICHSWEHSADLMSFQSRLNKVGDALKEWNATTIGCVPKRISQLREELEQLPFDDLSEENQRKRKETKVELSKLVSYNADIWKQRARVNWLKDGDDNTKFFHNYAKANGWRNTVTGIFNTHGVWQEDEVGIQNAFIDYFQALFTSDGCAHEELILEDIPGIVTSDMNAMLSAPFDREEIEQALKMMAANESPGSDGLSALFFQKFWSIVGDDVTQFCLGVLNDGKELSNLNHTLIALIPKVEYPNHVTDYRPISLCAVVYKLISKSIVNRMKVVLPSVISPFQSAFVKGRQIHDNVITAFELVHSIRGNRNPIDPKLVLKLDISKAYDRVEWSFLEKMMLKLGFAVKWVELILRCVKSVSFSILWQGKSVGKFQPTRGLRQGDPLSPFLFLLVSEGLSQLLQKAGREEMLHGVVVGNEIPAINHLLFADDSLVFLNAKMDDVMAIKQCLLLYERAAGQKINFMKSAVSFGPGVTDDMKEEITSFLGVTAVPFHERYLGLPTMAGKSKKQMFKNINDRLDNHMHGWKSKFLSKAGKMVLVKAVAQAIPTYTMSVFRLPKGVARSFQSKVSTYWWGNGKGKRGIHWGKWSLLCRSKKEGGLGFRDIEDFNQALLAKTVWRIALNPDSLVHSVLKSKYFPDVGWMKAVAGRGSSMIWNSLVWGRDLLAAGLRWRVGNGLGINVWEDKWLPKPWSFKVVSPKRGNSYLKVSNLMNQFGMWDVETLQSLFLPHEVETILSIPLAGKRQADSIVWHYTKDGNYTVRSGNRLAMELKQMELGSPGCSGGDNRRKSSWEILWGLCIPQKVKLFMWRAMHDFIPCTENLQRRHMKVEAGCSFCKGPIESTIHCLWECKPARQVWKTSFLYNVYRLWNEPNFLSLFTHVAAEFSDEELGLFCVIAWFVWKNRNARRFGEKVNQCDHLVCQAKEWLVEFKKVHAGPAGLSGDRTGTCCNKEKVRWSRPGLNVVKVNADAACDAVKGCTGVGAVIRDAAGQLLGALMHNINGALSPQASEAMAVLGAVRFCLMEQHKNVIVESDAANVMAAIKLKKYDLSEIGAVIEEVKCLSAEFESIQWSTIRRSGNQVAHILAKNALLSKGVQFWKESGPPWLHKVVIDDVPC